MLGEERSGRQPLSTFPQPREAGRWAARWEAASFPNLVVALQALGDASLPLPWKCCTEEGGDMRDLLLPSPGGGLDRVGCCGKSSGSWGDVSGRAQPKSRHTTPRCIGTVPFGPQ